MTKYDDRVRSTAKYVARSVAPHLVVEGWDARRQLQRLGAPVTLESILSFSRIRSSRLQLLPDGALENVHTVIDVGANVGEWSAAVLSLVKPTRLLAIEPDPSLYHVLLERFAYNSSVQIIQAAVADERSEGVLNLTSKSWANSVLTPNRDMGSAYAIEERVPVQVLTLDDIASDLSQIDLLKIDVQGLERLVLKGAESTLDRTHHVLLEVNFRSHYQGDALFSELVQTMDQLGFCLANLSEAWTLNARAMWSDAVFVRVI